MRAYAAATLALCLSACSGPKGPEIVGNNQATLDKHAAELPAARDLLPVLETEMARLKSLKADAEWSVISEEHKRIAAIKQAADAISPFPGGPLHACRSAAYSLSLTWMAMTGASPASPKEEAAQFDKDMAYCREQMSSPPEMIITYRTPAGHGAPFPGCLRILNLVDTNPEHEEWSCAERITKK